MDRRKIFVLVALLFILAVPLAASVCDEVFQAVPECTEGCITSAQVAALLNITLSQANSCLKDLKDAGQIHECTPSGGGKGYCR